MRVYNSQFPVFKDKYEVSEAEVVEHPAVAALLCFRVTWEEG